jgi:hypothetical protein
MAACPRGYLLGDLVCFFFVWIARWTYNSLGLDCRLCLIVDLNAAEVVTDSPVKQSARAVCGL